MNFDGKPHDNADDDLNLDYVPSIATNSRSGSMKYLSTYS